MEFFPLKSTEIKVIGVLLIDTTPQEDRTESLSSLETWITPYLDYLKSGILLQDEKEAKSLMYRATNYTLIDDMLYKHIFSFPYLRCL